MPVDDPKALGLSDWANLHLWLTLLWIFFPLVITFAFSMMTAHAFIPSAVMTGHLPPRVAALRLPLTVLGLLAAAAAVVLFILALLMTWDTLTAIWNRTWV